MIECWERLYLSVTVASSAPSGSGLHTAVILLRDCELWAHFAGARAEPLFVPIFLLQIY